MDTLSWVEKRTGRSVVVVETLAKGLHWLTMMWGLLLPGCRHTQHEDSSAREQPTTDCLSEPTDAGQFHRRIRTTDPFTLPGLLVMEELIHAESLRSSSLPRGTSDFRYVSFIDSRPIKLQIEKVAGLHGPSERGKAAPGWCTLCATSVVATQVSKVLMDLVVGQHVDYQRFL